MQLYTPGGLFRYVSSKEVFCFGGANDTVPIISADPDALYAMFGGAFHVYQVIGNSDIVTLHKESTDLQINEAWTVLAPLSAEMSEVQYYRVQRRIRAFLRDCLCRRAKTCELCHYCHQRVVCKFPEFVME
jgi:hypothetical protein